MKLIYDEPVCSQIYIRAQQRILDNSLRSTIESFTVEDDSDEWI